METFVLRIFLPADSAEVELAGIVEHVGSGVKRPFRGKQSLVAALIGGLQSRVTDDSEAQTRMPDGRGAHA
jgi:hypothetical protein